MKVAVCFYGNMRCWEVVKENNLKFFGDVDYFVYTTNKIQNDFVINYNEVGSDGYDSYTHEMIKDDFKDHNLVDYRIEDYGETNAALYSNARTYKVPFFIRHVNALKTRHELKTGIDYDIVIFCRTDCVFYSPSKIVWENASLEHQWVYYGERWHHYWDDREFAYDHLIFGTSALMNHIANYYHYKEKVPSPQKPDIYPEDALHAYYTKWNIETLPPNKLSIIGLDHIFQQIVVCETVREKEFYSDMTNEKMWLIEEDYKNART